MLGKCFHLMASSWFAELCNPVGLSQKLSYLSLTCILMYLSANCNMKWYLIRPKMAYSDFSDNTSLWHFFVTLLCNKAIISLELNTFCHKGVWKLQFGMIIDPLHDEYLWGNTDRYLHFLSFVSTDMSRVIKILPYGDRDLCIHKTLNTVTI